MPPIRNKTSENSVEQEGRIQLAISDLKNKKIRTIVLAKQHAFIQFRERL